MSIGSLRDTVRADLRHATAQWDATPWFWVVAATKCALYPRIRAVLWHRVAHELWRRRVGRPVALWLQARTLRVAGAEIHPAASIGPGLLLVHSAGIVIHPDAVIGADCALYQGVTLGERDNVQGLPRLGDRVRVGANAVILGPVRIGDDARVGAGAVVLGDIPDRGTAIGPPARVV